MSAPRTLALLILAGAAVVAALATVARGPPSNGVDPVARSREPTADARSLASGDAASSDAGGLAAGAETPRAGLSGRVVDAQTDEGIADAVVLLLGDERETATTDAAGAFRFDGLEPGRRRVAVLHPGYPSPGLEALTADATSSAPTVVVPKAGETPPALTLRLAPGPRVAGRVLDSDGRPVAGAEIRFRDGDGSRCGCTGQEFPRESVRFLTTQALAWSDAEGRFALSCFPPRLSGVRLGAVAPGRVGRWSEPLSLDPGGPAPEVLLTVVAAAGVAGRVSDSAGAPAFPAKVSFVSGRRLAKEWAFAEPEDAAVAADGAYRLEGLPPGTLSFEASWTDPHGSGARAEVPDLAPGERRAGVDFVVPTRHVLAGRLRDAAGRGLARQLLLVRSPSLEREEDVTTGDDGRFALGLPVAGPLEVVHGMPHGGEGVLRSGVVLPCAPLDLVSTPPKRTPLRLLVLDPDGRPIARFHSSVGSWIGSRMESSGLYRSEADGEGGVAVHDVPCEPPLSVSILQPRDAEGNDLPLCRRVVLESVPPDGAVEVRLARDDRASGRFVDETGQPVAGIVLVPRVKHETSAPLALGPDGRFEIAVDLGSPASPFSADVRVPEGYEDIGEIRLDPHAGEQTIVLPAGGTISGRVVTSEPLRPDATGETLRVFVNWWGWRRWGVGEGMYLGWAVAPVGSDGRWRATGVPLDTDLDVFLKEEDVMSHGYRPLPHITGCRAGQTDVELRLVAAERISGRCVDASGGPPDGKLYVFVSSLDRASSTRHSGAKVSGMDGRFSLGGLAPGAYRLGVRSDDEDAPSVLFHERVVAAGDESLEFRIPPRGSVRVGVATKPRGAWVTLWVAGTSTRVLSAGDWDWPGEIRGLPATTQYDLVVMTDDAIGSRGGVEVGDDVTVSLAPALPMSGRLSRPEGDDRPFFGALYALTRGACFDLFLEEGGEFGTEPGVLEGRYEIRYVEEDGTPHVVARDVAAGREDLDLSLK